MVYPQSDTGPVRFCDVFYSPLLPSPHESPDGFIGFCYFLTYFRSLLAPYRTYVFLPPILLEVGP